MPTRLAANLARVRQRIADAAQAAGRRVEEVKLVAVTKYVDAHVAAELVHAGCADLGESRPQSLWEKAEALAELPIRWHQLGHLQRNKVRRTLPYLSLLQSADSLRLLRTLDSCAGELDLTAPVLLEVNVSGEAAKGGFAPAELPNLWDELAQLQHLNVRGLMTMAALEGGPEVARRNFADLRMLRDRLRDQVAGPEALPELSMGMSRDFELAIQEGATIVRVGSALYEGL